MEAHMSRVVPLLLVGLCLGGCAHATPIPRVVASRNAPVTRLADLHLSIGTDCIVVLTTGGALRGYVSSVTPDALALQLRDVDVAPSVSTIQERDIATVATVVGWSRRARGWLGAAIGAAASLPFAISMFGDMMVPAGILGALIGRGTGDVRAEIVLQQRGS
jgi:hypothetical protein